MILAASAAPKQSLGRCPIPPPEHDWRAGKKSPGKVPGLSLREERAPGAETKRPATAGPLRFILW
jgi:hypothetical protein